MSRENEYFDLQQPTSQKVDDMVKQWEDYKPEKCVLNIIKLRTNLAKCKPNLASSPVSLRSGASARDSQKKVEDSF